MLTVMNAGLANSVTYYVAVTDAGGMVISLPIFVAVGNPSMLAWGNNNGQLGNRTLVSAFLGVVCASAFIPVCPPFLCPLARTIPPCR